MTRTLSFFLLLIVAATQVVATGGPLRRSACAQAVSIEDWKVKNPRAVFLGVRRPVPATYIVTFVNECFSRWPNNTVRVEARSVCLAPGDSMFFTFPPSEGSKSSGPEVRCVVATVEGPLPRIPYDDR